MIKYTLIFNFLPTTLQDIKRELKMERNELDIKLYMWQIFAGLDHLRKVAFMRFYLSYQT